MNSPLSYNYWMPTSDLSSLPSSPPPHGSDVQCVRDVDARPHEENELDMMQIADALLSSWRTWTAGMVLGACLGVGAGFVLPPKYEAHGVLQLAQSGNAQSGNAQSDSLLESVPDTMARLQSFSFRSKVVDRLIHGGMLGEADRMKWLKQLGQKAIFTPVKDAKYIEVTIQAPSPTLSLAVINQVASVLTEQQDVLLKQRKHQIQSYIGEAQAVVRMLDVQNKATAASTQGLSATDAALQAVARSANATAYVMAKQKLMEQQALLMPPTTRSAGLIEPAGVSPQPVGLSKGVLGLLGALLGGALAAGYGFLSTSWKHYQDSKQAA